MAPAPHHHLGHKKRGSKVAISLRRHWKQKALTGVIFSKQQSDAFGTEILGIIGFTTLPFPNINIDYGDRLEHMDYQCPPVPLTQRQCGFLLLTIL
jgi:hypothetical protein